MVSSPMPALRDSILDEITAARMSSRGHLAGNSGRYTRPRKFRLTANVRQRSWWGGGQQDWQLKLKKNGQGGRFSSDCMHA